MLTYTNCKSTELQIILKLLQLKFKEIGIKNYLIVREVNKVNKDQNHCHVVLILNKVKDVRNVNFLDLELGNVVKLHGNYKALKSRILAVKYYLKEFNAKSSDAKQDPEMILYSLGIAKVMDRQVIVPDKSTFICKINEALPRR